MSNWRLVALKSLKKEADAAYDNYYRSQSYHGEDHPTTVGYKKWYDEALKAVKDCENDA